MAAKQIERVTIQTAGGNTLELFYNPENNLLVVDLIAANECGGNEVVRMKLDETRMLSHCK
ncbi:MAG: hypothetical protein ABSB42_07965 [Tepidisphaeraceae bacterium]|jgi:hypothetical protein